MKGSKTMIEEVFLVCDRCGGMVPNISDSAIARFHGIRLQSMDIYGKCFEDYELGGFKNGFAFLCFDCEDRLTDFMNGKEVARL